MADITNVAQKAGKLFLPKTADAIFKIDGQVAFIAKANTSAQVQIQTTQSEIKGGQTNALIGVITTEKAVDISFSTPEWQPEFLAANIGTTIRYGEQNFYIDDTPYVADANGKITLPATPADKQIQVDVNGTWVTVALADSQTEVDLSAYGIKENDCVSVIALLPKDGKEISILVDTDPSIGELILKSPIFRGTKGKVGEAQYIFPSFALSGNWTQQFSADVSYEITGKAIAVAGEKCGESETYGYYREFVEDEDTNYSYIIIAPSAIELTVSDTETVAVYGLRGALSDKEAITTGVTFAIPSEDSGIATVTSAGVVTAVGAGTTTLTAKYGENDKYTATATVTVTTA